MKTGELTRTIRLPQVVALYIGAVMGSGILLVPGLAAQMAGPASLIAWGFMLILVLPMGLVMGMLASKYPNAGGVSHFVKKAFGERWGVYIGWLFLMSVVIGGPINALVGADYLAAAMGFGTGMKMFLATFMIALGILVNYRGFQVGGTIQLFVIGAIILVLLATIFGSVPNIEATNFTPFVPHGWMAVGQAMTILFWCFIGWEAVSHLSEEFVNPKRDSILGVIIAAGIVGLLYFFTAFATVGTGNVGSGRASVSLLSVIQQILGPIGGLFAGVVSFLICTATAIAYLGAASRLAYALGRDGNAPRFFSRLSQHQTPVGGLIFLAFCFILVLLTIGMEWTTLEKAIQLPNASFIVIYLIGCAAGVRLLRDSKWGKAMSWISLVATLAVVPFIGWSVLYPLIIAAMMFLFTRKYKLKQGQETNIDQMVS
ncbi:amino acid permease [Risungbinella massiliensis]|uniref:amino acid permease n=1 Tax=Risungbinella massiliensis TaxID=1329796 RepID=UPI0005CC349A|nr:amino acid permease [Risungbinella massiliensis]